MENQEHSFDDIINLFGTTPVDLFGNDIANKLKNKYTDKKILNDIYNKLKDSQLLNVDTTIKNLIESIPQNLEKEKFNNLFKELQKLQIYSYLINCDEIKKILDDKIKELTDEKENIEGNLNTEKQEHEKTKNFIGDLINALNNKLEILNNMNNNNINNNNNNQQGGYIEKYQKKYFKYKTKYLYLKNYYKNIPQFTKHNLF